MQTLTKREKVLLYVLLCVVIFCGCIFLLIMPALEKHTELSTEYDMVKGQLISEKGNVVEYGDLDAQIKTISDEYEGVVQNFYTTAMLNEDVDALITALAQNHGLIPVSLNIAELSDEEVKSYEAYLEDLKKGEGNQNKKEMDPALVMKTYNVSLQVSGSIANLQSLVDEANQSKSLKISSVTYSDQSDEEKDMTVTFKIFLI